MYRKYLGDQAIIFGIDIDPEAAALNAVHGQVRIGSQADSKFIRNVINEMGGVDIIIDDGSHRMDDIKTTLEVLFPLLANHGIYIIEDLHTAYWPDYGGSGYGNGNFFNYLNNIVHEMHHWYHDKKIASKRLGKYISCVNIYDSIVVIEKATPHKPVHSKVGSAQSI